MVERTSVPTGQLWHSNSQWCPPVGYRLDASGQPLALVVKPWSAEPDRRRGRGRRSIGRAANAHLPVERMANDGGLLLGHVATPMALNQARIAELGSARPERTRQLDHDRLAVVAERHSDAVPGRVEQAAPVTPRHSESVHGVSRAAARPASHPHSYARREIPAALRALAGTPTSRQAA